MQILDRCTPVSLRFTAHSFCLRVSCIPFILQACHNPLARTTSADATVCCSFWIIVVWLTRDEDSENRLRNEGSLEKTNITKRNDKTESQNSPASGLLHLTENDGKVSRSWRENRPNANISREENAACACMKHQIPKWSGFCFLNNL